MSSIGPYLLCSNGDPATADAMFLDPPYRAGAWEWLYRRVATSVYMFASVGITAKHAAIKYIAGQSLGSDGHPSPKFLDILALRDQNIAPNVFNGIEPNMNTDAMVRFEDRVERLGIERIFYYMGQAPTDEEREALSDEDWADLATVMNSSRGEWIIDSACYPPKYADTRLFINQLQAVGVRQAQRRFHGEAFPEGMQAWPNVPTAMCFGEDAAWHAMARPSVFRCGVGLLHSGSIPPNELPANQYRLNVRDAIRSGCHCSIPIDVMPADHRAEVFGVGEGANS